MYVSSFKHMLVKNLSKEMSSPNPILTRCLLYIVVVVWRKSTIHSPSSRGNNTFVDFNAGFWNWQWN